MLSVICTNSKALDLHSSERSLDFIDISKCGIKWLYVCTGGPEQTAWIHNLISVFDVNTYSGLIFLPVSQGGAL